ncbi:MAG: PH domain-containing protein, partial [Acidimicrobiia bacterium]
VTDFVLVPFVVAVTAGGWPVLKSLGLVGFRSWLESDRVRVESGLLSRRESEAPLARIQLVGVGRPLLRRLVGLETVEMATGELTISRENAVTRGMVAPLVEIGGWRDLARQLIGPVALGETDLRRSSPYTKRRSMVRGTIATAVVVGLALVGSIWLDLGWWPPAAIAITGLGLTVGYSLARYRVLGWSADGDHVIVRRGVFSRRLSIVPIRKVQDVSITETVFQRRLGIATVEVDTAGIGISSAGEIKAIDLAREDARALADHLVGTAARIALPDGV